MVTRYEFRVELEEFSPIGPCPEALTLCLEGHLETILEMQAWIELEGCSKRV